MTVLLGDNSSSDCSSRDLSPRGQLCEGDHSPRDTFVQGDSCASALLCEGDTSVVVCARIRFLCVVQYDRQMTLINVLMTCNTTARCC